MSCLNWTDLLCNEQSGSGFWGQNWVKFPILDNKLALKEASHGFADHFEVPIFDKQTGSMLEIMKRKTASLILLRIQLECTEVGLVLGTKLGVKLRQNGANFKETLRMNAQKFRAKVGHSQKTNLPSFLLYREI